VNIGKGVNRPDPFEPRSPLLFEPAHPTKSRCTRTSKHWASTSSHVPTVPKSDAARTPRHPLWFPPVSTRPMDPRDARTIPTKFLCPGRVETSHVQTAHTRAGRYSADWPPLQCRHRPLARLPTTPVTSVRHGCHRHAQRRKENISIPHFHRHRHLARRPRLLLHTAVSRLQPPMGRITARQHFQQRAESSAPRSPQIPLYIQPAPPRSLPKAAAPSVRSKSPARLTAGRLAPGHLADSSSLSLRRFTDSPTASTSGRRALSRAASYGESFPPPTVKLESPPPHVVAHRIWPPLPPAAPECHELSALPCSC
jgi:hypothetical protein